MLRKAENNLTHFKIESDFEVNKLSYNSRSVENNDVFFAVKGFKFDGNNFIADAFRKGAKAVFTDSKTSYNNSKTRYTNLYKVQDIREAMAVLSNIFYGYPSLKMKMIGVTGTNGKTTVTSIINHVFASSGKKNGLIGTNNYTINKKKFESTHTTPEALDLNALLFLMNQEQVEYAVMEVSSHALSLKRVYDIDFDCVVFTNFTPEHLDFHKNMEEYFNAKKILFDSVKEINRKGKNTYAVYNIDDDYGEKIVQATGAKKISYGFGNADYRAFDVSMSFEGMTFKISAPDRSYNSISTNLTGRFNVYNILASVAALQTFGFSYSTISSAIKEFSPVPGRFNKVKLRNGALAIIDYSHTPDSLFNALNAIKEIMNSAGLPGKVITVFGCGGDRDKTKRPKMGNIASEYSDLVIVTSDNPRFEEPNSIIQEIVTGISRKNFVVEEDRRKAIELAIEKSRVGDVILVAGKGHETYQEIKGIRHHLSDTEIVNEFALNADC